MYKVLLILRYLRKRRIAWVSLLAVALCTLMVIVIISVMGGWLRMFKASFHGLSGDILVSTGSMSGFPHYQEMIEKIEQLPNVTAAVPVIHGFGAVKIGSMDPVLVQVLGFPVDPETGDMTIGQVNNFPRSLWRQYAMPIQESNDSSLSEVERKRAGQLAAQGLEHPSFKLVEPADVYRNIVSNPRINPEHWPGLIVGAGVVGLKRDTGLDDWAYRIPTTLTVIGADAGRINMNSTVERKYWLVDDSRTKVWQYDQKTVYVPFDVLQKDLAMDQQQATNDKTGESLSIPARASEIYVKVKPGVDLLAKRKEVQGVVDDVEAQYGDIGRVINVETWEQSQALWIGAIEKEEILVLFLFGIVSLVAVFLIFCIFYMIVVEKTRDIGIIKSVGATSQGVAGIFLGYGLSIGIVGAGLGLGLAYLVVHYINQIHAWLGRTFGIQIWDPQVYAFDTIPNKLDPLQVTVIIVVAILAAVLGALLPAVRAARLNPVEALRWE